ncbi:MAG: transglutaminase domain-containing protein [bacterium]|nr:transglutaminase domain-containing protein [bacterium]
MSAYRPTSVLNSVMISIFAAALVLSCALASGYPPGVDEALSAAGDNRPELEKVLEHYAAEGDSLKLEATYFLIANMEGHSYVTYMLHDSNEVEIEFNVLDYANYDELVAAAESLEAERGTIDYKRKEKFEDLEYIKADFLINQIDLAFEAWRERPWTEYLSFEQFCEFILPYRGSNEPLEDWRGMFLEKYAHIPEQMEDASDPVGAARLINEDILTYFGFDPRYYYHPTDQGLGEMLESKLGRCEDMTNITIYAMRANGLAVTSDYTPHWADQGNNHAWNAILVPGGKVVPFMGAEASPGEYDLSGKAAKVYRKTFGQQADNLVFQEHKQDSVPRWLNGKSYVDVTAEYVSAISPTIEFSEQVPDSVDIAYICVFNSGEWKAIDWSRIEEDKVTFEDLGPDVILLPALYLNKEIVPWGPPFTLSETPAPKMFIADENSKTTMRLTSTSGRLKVPEGKLSALTEGVEYTLSYWNDGWQEIGRSVATDQPLEFYDVPEGALYWLTAKDSDREERVFNWEDGAQIWW